MENSNSNNLHEMRKWILCERSSERRLAAPRCVPHCGHSVGVYVECLKTATDERSWWDFFVRRIISRYTYVCAYNFYSYTTHMLLKRRPPSAQSSRLHAMGNLKPVDRCENNVQNAKQKFLNFPLMITFTVFVAVVACSSTAQFNYDKMPGMQQKPHCVGVQACCNEFLSRLA